MTFRRANLLLVTLEADLDQMERLPTSATGTAWERTPWHATQRAAWEALDSTSRQ